MTRVWLAGLGWAWLGLAGLGGFWEALAGRAGAWAGGAFCCKPSLGNKPLVEALQSLIIFGKPCTFANRTRCDEGKTLLR